MVLKEELLQTVEIICDTLSKLLENCLPYDDALCCVIEDMLTHQLTCDKDKLWALLRAVSHHSQNEFLEGMENLSSHAGFVRAWVRVTLNDGAICSALKVISEDDTTQEYYDSAAFIMDPNCVEASLRSLRTLDKHELNYVCNTVVLNQWRSGNSGDYLGEEEVIAEGSPGFNRRYSIGNKLSISCVQEDSYHTSTSSSCTDIQETDPTTPQLPCSESGCSENPVIWRNSQSDVRLSSISDLSNLHEERGSTSSLVYMQDTQERLQYFTVIPKEYGLSHQAFKCFSCDCVIGNQGQDFKVCSYDKLYYCSTCFGNYQHYIPSKLIYNWDHNKYRISRKSFDFLTQVQNLPNIDQSKLNISLYNHVTELRKVKDYRTILNMIREYLVRCTTQGEELYNVIRKKLGTRTYYWDTPHLYSITDLSKVYSGQLHNSLKKIVDNCTQHVYCCKRCTDQGFICEYCKHPKIIFAFELQTTDQCPKCSAVYHKTCSRNAPCPKCIRKEQTVARTTPTN